MALDYGRMVHTAARMAAARDAPSLWQFGALELAQSLGCEVVLLFRLPAVAHRGAPMMLARAPHDEDSLSWSDLFSEELSASVLRHCTVASPSWLLDQSGTQHGVDAAFAALFARGVQSALFLGLFDPLVPWGFAVCLRMNAPLEADELTLGQAVLTCQLLSLHARMLEAGEQVAQLRERLLAAERSKDHFIATVSHELRTPLHAIAGWTQLLQSGALSPERAQHAIDVIARNAASQQHLVDELIALSHALSGTLPLQVEQLDLAQVVQRVFESLRLSADAKQITFELSLSGDCPVRADSTRLSQVVRKLIANAIKFTPPGGHVKVSVSKQCDRLELTVEDNGEGIAPHFLPHVFELFRQQDEGSARKQQGLGLGLSLVKQLVELHGGSVELTSQGVGQGTKSRVVLPGV